jgi:phytoene desaturase
MPPEVVVIGGGFGGFSAACYLADAGASVTVVERNDQLGGRASTLERDGFRFDMGPSWYLMPDVFERFFGHFGRTPAEFYALQQLDPNYRAFFKDGDRIDVRADVDQMARLFEDYEDGAGAALRDYVVEAADAYHTGMKHFVYTDRPRFRDYVDWDVVRNARGLGLLGSMADHVAESFDHPKLRQIVQYSLVFLGGSPSTTPALYKLMTHVDLNQGVYYPDGGIAAVVDGVVELGGALGVEYVTGREVTRIDGQRGRFRVHTRSRPDRSDRVATAGDPAAREEGVDSASLAADIVVSDADVAHTEQELLPADHRQYDADYWDSRTYAPSAFLLYLGIDGDLDPLAHHSLVLPTDWDPHFASIFEEPAWPEDPAYYVCAPSVTDDDVAPEGCSALFVLVPIAPDLDDDPETRERYREHILADLAATTGVELQDRIRVEERFSVSDFARRYNSTAGSALGLAHTLRQTGPMRPDHRSSACPGLYFTGGYTRPGIGVPMCLISGEHAARAVAEDLEELAAIAPDRTGPPPATGAGSGPAPAADPDDPGYSPHSK